MKIKKGSNREERLILTGMIVDSTVCGCLVTKWSKDMFRSRYANLVAEWCLKYYDKYGKAPGNKIENLFSHWSEKATDEDTIALIEKFLQSLSDDYVSMKRESNPDYILSRAAEYFTKVKLEKLRDTLEDDLLAGDTLKAAEKVTNYTNVNLSIEKAIDIPNCQEHFKKALDEKHEPLIVYPGAMGKFYGNRLERGGFITFFGPEKRGKCISENTKVLLSNGKLKTIKWIVEHKCKIPIMALNEKTQRLVPIGISEFWNNGSKECWEVITRTGRRIRTTSNHLYLTPDGWKELETLKPGDFVAVPKKIDVFGTKHIPENELLFVAYLLADGSCTQGSLIFTKSDPVLVHDFEFCCDKLNLGHWRKDINTHILKTRWIQEKYPECLYHVSSKTKQLPKKLFECSKHQIAKFLQVFFSCDGYINKSGNYIELSLANRLMCSQISHLLNRFGIVHTLESRSVLCKGKRFPCWQITIRSQEYVNLFLNEIGFLSYKVREPTIGIPSKSFLDKFPWQVACRFHDEAKIELNKKGRYYHTFQKSGSVREQIVKHLPLMRQSFSELNGTKTYDKFMNSHILWDQLISIRSVGFRQTYDIAIPKHHNFVGNDFIVHNSYVLHDIAYQAIKQRKRVAFFEAGDMTENDILVRWACRLSHHPLYSGKIAIPRKMIRKKRGVKVIHEYTTFRKGLSHNMVWEACERFMDRKIKSRESYLKLSCHPNSTLTVESIENTLKDWDRSGWTADVVIIDYADILNIDVAKMDKREQIDRSWKGLRRISQQYNCLVVTASQTNRESYDANIITKKHTSEDKRKLAHVTGAIGLNQTESEKKAGIMRFNWVVMRKGRYTESKCIYVAGCLDISSPVILSIF